MVRALLRQPLLHFLVIGGALFAVVELTRSEARQDPERERIEVGAQEIAWLRDNFAARWMRPPSEEELRGLVREEVRQEMLYREALALRLDRGDEIVRRRLAQKVEFMTEDLASLAQPTETELRAFLEQHAADYETPERRRFVQVYFNPDRRGDALLTDAEALLAELRASEDADVDVTELGDRLLVEPVHVPVPRFEVERQFGEGFAVDLFALEPDAWQGPIGSGYGLHLVRVTEVVAARPPELAQVRERVLRDYATITRERAREALTENLAQRYEVTIDEDAIRAGALPGTGEEARR